MPRGASPGNQEAYRGRKVISISGDGGFGQYMGDFTTAVKYNMDITHSDLITSTSCSSIFSKEMFDFLLLALLFFPSFF